MDQVIDGDKPMPKDGASWFSLNVHWWDSNVVLGPVSGNPGGDVDVWATGEYFADAIANAVRYVEGMGHRADIVQVNT